MSNPLIFEYYSRKISGDITTETKLDTHDDNSTLVKNIPVNLKYKTSAENYNSYEDIIYINEVGSITIPVVLTPEEPASTDYEYTVQGDNSAILTKYIGANPVVVGPDFVKGDL